MATGVLAPMKFHSLRGLQSIPVAHGFEAASQTYKTGELLIMSSGRMAVSTADPVSIVVGIALKDSTGTTDSDVPYIPLMEGVLIEASFMGAAAADYISALTDREVAYGVAVSSNKWYIDQSETTAPLFRLVMPAGDFVIGDTNIRGVFRPITAKYLP